LQPVVLIRLARMPFLLKPLYFIYNDVLTSIIHATATLEN